MKSQICNKCNIEKEIVNFKKNSAVISGYNLYCIQCRAVYVKDYYNNPENKAKVKISTKKYYLKNKERLLLIGKGYRDGTDVSIYRSPRITYSLPLWIRKREKMWKVQGIKDFTYEKYEAMLLLQNNKCYLCNNPPSKYRNLDVDHNHKTGKVRRLLCNKCNMGIGVFKDDIKIIINILKYLQEHE